MLKALERPWRYRLLTLAGIILAMVIVVRAPQHFSEVTDWGYTYAAENFSHGRLIIDDNLHLLQANVVRSEGGELVNYVQVGQNWAFEKAPGYVFYLVPFYLLGMPWLGNMLLALGLLAVTYVLLARLKNEKLAMVGVLLLVFTPACLSMWQRFYMDSFAALAFSGMGGGLYLYYQLERPKLKPFLSAFVLFMAALLLGWSVVVRYSNFLIALIFGLHFLISRAREWDLGRRQPALREVLPFGLGALLPLLILLGYQQTVFGSPLLTGYSFSHAAVFAWNPADGWSAWRIIHDNVSGLWAPLLVGYPLLMVALPALGVIAYQKLRPRPAKGGPANTAELWPGIDRGLLLLITGWVVVVFGLYMLYQETAVLPASYSPFMIPDRFYLPAALPLVLMAAPLLARLSRWLLVSIMVAVVLLGLCFYMQSSLTQNVTYQFQLVLLPLMGLKRPGEAGRVE